MTDAKADDDEKFINALANDIRKDNNVNTDAVGFTFDDSNNKQYLISMCNDNSGDITCEDGGEWCFIEGLSRHNHFALNIGITSSFKYKIRILNDGKVIFGYGTNKFEPNDMWLRTEKQVILGDNQYGWGLNIDNGTIKHNNETKNYMSNIDTRNDTYQCEINLNKKIIGYYKNGEYLGNAFENININNNDSIKATLYIYKGTAMEIYCENINNIKKYIINQDTLANKGNISRINLDKKHLEWNDYDKELQYHIKLYANADNTTITSDDDDTKNDDDIKSAIDTTEQNVILYRNRNANDTVQTTENRERNNKFVTNLYEGLTDDDDSKENAVNTKKINAYSFGYTMHYHGQSNAKKSRSNFINPTFNSLKQEMLKNDFYKLTQEIWEKELRKAIELQTKKNITNKYIAKQRSWFNKLAKIYAGQGISLCHLIVLSLYTGYTDLQCTFKRKAFYNVSLSKDEIFSNNCNIGNWCKLLFECVYYFGDTSTKKQVFYHGISNKFVFDNVYPMFQMPISTSVSYDESIQFTNDKNGILIELKQFNQSGTEYINVEPISKFPNEKERLFYNMRTLRINNIYTFDVKSGKRVSNKKFIIPMFLFDRLRRAKYPTNISTKLQDNFVVLIDIMYKKDRNSNPYIYDLFLNILNKWNKTFIKNPYVFGLLNDTLQNHLNTKLFKMYDNIKFVDVIQHKYFMNQDTFKEFISLKPGKSIQIPTEYSILINNYGKMTFKISLQKEGIIHEGQCVFSLVITSQPDTISLLHIQLEIYGKEVNETKSFMNWFKTGRQLPTQIFKTKKLDKTKTLTLDFVLKIDKIKLPSKEIIKFYDLV